MDDFCEHHFCGDCEHWAHPYDGGCQKRIDHKRVKFYTPGFKSYDGHQRSGFICSEFCPSERCVYSKNHWISFADYWPQYVRDWVPYSDTNVLVHFTISNDEHTSYGVKIMDFVYGNMYIDDKLKAIEKMYYKQVRTEGSFPYKLVREAINGVKI